MRRETRYGTESYYHLASKVPQVFHDGEDGASNNSIKSPCSWSGAALSELVVVVECWFRASIKCKSPFDQSAYQGSGPLVHPRKSLWDMRKPQIWLLHRPDFPRHGRGICLLYRTNWEACCQRGTNQNFIVDGSPQHGIWIVQLRTQSYHPHHFLG